MNSLYFGKIRVSGFSPAANQANLLPGGGRKSPFNFATRDAFIASAEQYQKQIGHPNARVEKVGDKDVDVYRGDLGEIDFLKPQLEQGQAKVWQALGLNAQYLADDAL